MKTESLRIGSIPALLWGEPSDHLFIHVHGKMSRKEYASDFAGFAEAKGWQTLSFDLPQHGDRAADPALCDVWQGMHDLNLIADYAFSHWKHVSLFACSLGAYFSLNAYVDRPFELCLFQSPIVDMAWLVRHMMLWSNVTEEELREKQRIETPIDLLRWDYYSYILAHPVTDWPHPTAVLYGALDDLQPIEALQAFASRFSAGLTVAENSRHPFMEEDDLPIVAAWLQKNIPVSHS